MTTRTSLRRLEMLTLVLAAASLAFEARAAVLRSEIGGTDIFVSSVDTGVLEPAIEPPPPPAESTPLPPFAVHFFGKTTHSMLVQWADASSVESGYRVERRVGSRWVTVASQGPVLPGFVYEGGEVKGSGQFLATGLSHNTQYCFRAMPWNDYGEPASVPIGCARTNRIIGPNTVLVTDADGFQGELADPTPPYSLAVPFGGLGIAYDPTDPEPAPLDPPDFPVPPAVKVIYVADGASLDLTNYSYSGIKIPAGITIASGRGGLAEGALLYSNSTTTTKHTMLFVDGDGVRITGLRFRGPSPSTSSDNGNATAILVANARDVVIDHNEFFNWPTSGINVKHDPGLLNPLTAYRMRVTENYFHHNQRQGLGYGVTVSSGSYPWIDKNTFDWNRHAIASDGGRHTIVPGYGPRHGYLAYLNLVLPGHTEQVVDYWYNRQTHHFDVHGSEDPGHWVGGWAGEFIDVADNSFLGILGTAFYVRGTPSASAQFHHNVLPPVQPFPQTGSMYGLDGGNAYYAGDGSDYGWWSVNSESDRDNVDVYGNQPSPDPRQRLAVGDFDGDGRDDVFLATGRAWYVCYGGVTEWRFLNKSTRKIETLAFTDVDGDGRTDVLTHIGGVLYFVSRSGRSEFVPLPATPAIDTQTFSSDGDVIGDFSGDGVLDRLRFDLGGDRYFRTFDGRTGETRQSRHQM